MTKKTPRSIRVRRIADLIADRWERRAEEARKTDKKLSAQTARRSVMRRKPTPDIKRQKIPPLIAYDLETTNIKEGTPKPLYITGYGEDYFLSTRIKNIEHLADIVRERILCPENVGKRFVAHNGNKFDAYFIAAALLYDPNFHIKPYLAGDSNFRGMLITEVGTKNTWEFLDSMSMTGVLRPLSVFLKTFAPDYLKLDGPDFSKETFDPDNKKHVEYAERDSEGLYHAIMKAQSVVFDTFGMGLQTTAGNLGIKLFMQHVPEGVNVVRPAPTPLKIIRDYVMRGGYCHLSKQFSGPVWRYDINQAYAAAMRDVKLPGGRCMSGVSGKKPKYAECAIYRITATNPKNKVPFYYVSISDDKRKFATTEIEETWITSVELEQLEKEGWEINYLEYYMWESSFNMKSYVDKLERLRSSGEGGVKGAQGEMIKAIGNNSYGKTVERLKNYELCMAAERPEGWGAYYDEDSPINHVWFRFTTDENTRAYHQPQIGAFITAHVRMVLRQNILKDPDAFIYADTDGISFSRPVPMDIDSKKYGLWKVEAEGEHYIFIDKKVYCSIDGDTKHAKGMNIKSLNVTDFERWFSGNVPIQTQCQRVSFLRTMSGADMFRDVVKRGSNQWAREKVAASGPILR